MLHSCGNRQQRPLESTNKRDGSCHPSYLPWCQPHDGQCHKWRRRQWLQIQPASWTVAVGAVGRRRWGRTKEAFVWHQASGTDTISLSMAPEPGKQTSGTAVRCPSATAGHMTRWTERVLNGRQEQLLELEEEVHPEILHGQPRQWSLQWWPWQQFELAGQAGDLIGGNREYWYLHGQWSRPQWQDHQRPQHRISFL